MTGDREYSTRCPELFKGRRADLPFGINASVPQRSGGQGCRTRVQVRHRGAARSVLDGRVSGGYGLMNVG